MNGSFLKQKVNSYLCIDISMSGHNVNLGPENIAVLVMLGRLAYLYGTVGRRIIYQESFR